MSPCDYEKQRAKDMERRLQRVEHAMFGYLSEEYPQIAVTDMLADLMHYCEREGINMERAVQTAHEHYQAEKRGDT
jgi:predicted DNA-binding helix-hairpin-helix protein